VRVPTKHVITLTVDGREVEGWTDYDISVSMLEPADAFTVSMPFDTTAWSLCAPDRAVRVNVDRTTVITGFIDSRKKASKDGTLSISGRCKAGRLVQESAPTVNFAGTRISSLFKLVGQPWFTTVTLSNARNRNVLRGRGVKVRSNDKVYLDSVLGSRIEPGCTKWEVIHDICEQAGYLAWSSGDGKELVVGKPNYDQQVQFRFLHPGERSSRRGNVIDLDIEDSVADRFAKLMVVGSGRGDEGNYGIAPASRWGIALDGPNEDGTGKDFKYPKELIVADRYGIKSKADATTRAKREMARRNMRARVVTVTAPMHGQILEGGAEPTLFVPDTLAYLEDEETDIRETFIVVGCTYRSSKKTGEVTTLELIPKGTELTL
jgi:prophage tail gpP-like protein